MSKTPEQLAEEEADRIERQAILCVSLLAMNDGEYFAAKKAYKAGYQAAKDTYREAISAYEDVAKQMLEEALRIMSPKDQLADTDKVMNSPEKQDTCEHILDMEKMVDVNSSSGWISVKEVIIDGKTYRLVEP